ncbi:MAG TPA: 50S ribosomal protein L15 [Nitrospiraceae bacterium]|nr:50S ribosomal protein L15 [Nitrospiraceae bacterium]
MKLEELKPSKGAKKRSKRVGRGAGSGLGKTSGKGHKGQKSRSGGVKPPGFEGGQMPLQRKIPKRGFTNIFRKEYAIVNLSDLAGLEGTDPITPEVLVKNGIIKKAVNGVKVLGMGALKAKLVVRAHKFSKSAVDKIQAAGGKAEVI